MRHIAYIGIGSNLGDKARQCQRGISEILKIDRHRLLARSSLYKTEPVGYSSQDWFVNGVIQIETELEPLELLRALKALEVRLGRRPALRWGPRAIDLDILFFDDQQVEAEELTLPHPRVAERRFVLVPLAEIAPQLVHPASRRTVQELLGSVQGKQGVEKLESAGVSQG